VVQDAQALSGMFGEMGFGKAQHSDFDIQD
jgi:hypothetical protein